MRSLILLILTIPLIAQPPTVINPGSPVASAVINANYLGLFNGRVGRWSGSGAPGDFPFSIVGDIYYDTASQGTAYICYKVHCTSVGATNWVQLPAGSVTSFSAGTLSPLFTTSVANSTTTPALSFTLNTAAANSVFGNFTGSTATP